MKKSKEYKKCLECKEEMEGIYCYSRRGYCSNCDSDSYGNTEDYKDRLEQVRKVRR